MDGDKWSELALGTVIAQDFSDEAMGRRPVRLKTGFAQLDRMLGGGLGPGLTVLGGSPGLGKSTFALQLACRVAQGGTPVLFFSLEMFRERLAAKAISRQIFEAGRQTLPGGPVPRADILAKGITAVKLCDDRRLTEEQRELLAQVRRNPVGGKNLHIMENALPAEEICGQVRAFREEHPGAVPLVIVDYLQILPPDDAAKIRSNRQVVEESLRHMVQLAHSGLPVFLLSSLNRGSYNAAMQLDAFKETGGIEYSADVLIGLQFSACRTRKNWTMEAEKERLPRLVDLVLLKQRYGSSGSVVPLRYYAEFDYFEEAVGPAPVSADDAELAASLKAAELAVEASAPSEPERAEAGETQPAPKERKPVWYMNNTRLANDLRQGKARAGQEPIACRVMDGVVTTCKLSEPLTRMEWDAADAVYTLFRRGEEGFTLHSVLKTMSGDRKISVPTGRRKLLLAQAVEKFIRTRIAIDCTDEMRQRKKLEAGGERWVIQGPFLTAERSGNGWRFLDGTDAAPFLEGWQHTPMPLYTYAQLSRQMVSFPPDLLTMPPIGGRKQTDTWERIALKRSLIWRIEVVRHPGSKAQWMRTISFKEDNLLVSELGLRREDYQTKAAWEQHRKELRKTTAHMLRHYQAIGYIGGWEDLKDSVRFSGPFGDPWEL